MSPDAPTHEPGRDARATAIIDMGSNSFRLVVYHWMPGGWFRLVDEIREAVRLSEGQTDGRLQPRALARADAAAFGARLETAVALRDPNSRGRITFVRRWLADQTPSHVGWRLEPAATAGRGITDDAGAG